MRSLVGAVLEAILVVAHAVVPRASRRTSIAIAVVPVVLAAACGSPDGFIEVTIPIERSLGIDQLRFTISASGVEPRSVTAPEAPEVFADNVSAGFIVPPELAGTDVIVAVDAFAGGVEGALVASGKGEVTTVPGQLVKLTIALSPLSRCGDGAIDGTEACDDGNTDAGDGCDGSCTVEAGHVCIGTPSACTRCGDGTVEGAEGCDDGNAAPGDGCDATCTVEAGYSCDGSPSACAPVCGDGLVQGDEGCDDAALVDGDGCTALCALETGWSCAGEPSACGPACGDGVLVGGEQCDDAGTTAGDGCDAGCVLEAGWDCQGEPSACSTICGDALVRGTEACDDGLLVAGDGCATDCSAEAGWVCDAAEPTRCSPSCGDGILLGAEACDDGNASGGDGCDATCAEEGGFDCTGTPSACAPLCGDGLVRGGETCDDGAALPGDGCGADCRTEAGFACDAAEPSACAPVCGDGLIVGIEGCDDGGVVTGDGCDAACDVEPGFACAGSPSTCATVCGDGIRLGAEECDDGASNSDLAPDACRTDCTLPFCGDLVADTGAGEGCDDGNTSNADACLTGCRAPACGDGFLRGGEGCDDGNNAAGDGCGATCQIEGGFQCGGVPSRCGTAARTHVVAPTGGDFTTLSTALSSGGVQNGDLILVSAGTYTDEPVFSKSVTVAASAGAVVEGDNNSAPALAVTSNADVVIQGLTIRNTGRGESAIEVLGVGSSLVLEGATLGPSDQFGVDAAIGTTVTLRRTLVTDNNAGGLELRGAYTIENSVFRANSVRAVGFQNGSSGTFRFNTVTANPIGVVCSVAATLTSSILFANTTANTQGSCTFDGSVVGVDPSFAADGFHLNAGSVALDATPLAACPPEDFDNDARPIGSACEVGADERP